MSQELKATVRSVDGQERSVDLPPELFGRPVREHLLFEAVRAYLASRRAGTHSTKTRGEVSGGGKKPWRQKGTGRARAGSIRSPLWVGGATVFGPKPRDYSYSLPKRAEREAIRSALCARYRAGNVVFVEGVHLPEAKTKAMASFLKSLGVDRALVVLDDRDEAVERAARNLPGVAVATAQSVNVYEILRYPRIVMTVPAMVTLQKRLGN